MYLFNFYAASLSKEDCTYEKKGALTNFHFFVFPISTTNIRVLELRWKNTKYKKLSTLQIFSCIFGRRIPIKIFHEGPQHTDNSIHSKNNSKGVILQVYYGHFFVHYHPSTSINHIRPERCLKLQSNPLRAIGIAQMCL